MSARTPRRYRSAVKRGEAAPAILAAARRLFAERGFSGTAIEDIAREAEVARPTVFAAVGAKPVIFRTVLEKAVAGESPVAPVPEQEWFHSILAHDDQRAILSAYAHRVRETGERISELYWAAEVAAEQDETVRALWGDIEGGRLGTGPAIVEALIALAPLRAEYSRAEAAAIVTSIASPANWRALVRDAGWSPQRYEEWATDTLARTLLR